MVNRPPVTGTNTAEYYQGIQARLKVDKRGYRRKGRRHYISRSTAPSWRWGACQFFLRRETCFVLASLALFVCGCGTTGPEAFSEGLAEYRAQHWHAAIRRFSDALMRDPDLSAAHFYIGMCYLRTDPPWPVVAAGELTLALEFLDNDQLEPLPGAAPDEVRAQIHTGMGDSYRLQARVELLRTGRVDTSVSLLDKARLEYQRAGELRPQDPEIERKRAQLEDERTTLLNAVPFIFER